MKTLRHSALVSLCALGSFALRAQVTAIPEKIDPNDSLVIEVDLNALDQSQEYVQNLTADADAGLDIYIWTWRPKEHPAGHPFENGQGTTPWKNSNELLKMTKIAERKYRYTFKPTLIAWYETDAATAYANDLFFLVKPKDGGGYGSPDRKSDDLSVPIDPPATDRLPAWKFPALPQQNDAIVVTYENFREDSVYMQNLAPDDCYLYVECTDTAGVVHRPSAYLQVGNNPDLQMDYIGGGVFQKMFFLEEIFNFSTPVSIKSYKFIVRRKDFAFGEERVPYDIAGEVGCP
ncbi:hypothetical protein GC167_06355 [bacterium]|nr:hypothetical protein [bacterium]